MSKKGIHLYMRVNGMNKIIKREEDNNDDLTRVFHWLDSFLLSLDSFINRYDDAVYIEKLDGTRIHLVIYDGTEAGKIFIDLIGYAFHLLEEMKNTQRYSRLTSLNLSMGADYGFFNEYEFNDFSIDFSEDTTIGYPANYAAKVQKIANSNQVLITDRVLNILKNENLDSLLNISRYNSNLNRSRFRYDNLPGINDIDIRKMRDFLFDSKSADKFKSEIDIYKERQNSTNHSFYKINVTGSNTPVDFEDLTLKNNKKTDGVVIYADIRGFTKQFKEDGSNLSIMTHRTMNALDTMYRGVKNQASTHVQFQGDRESALRNKYGERDYVLSGLHTALELLDEVKKTGFNVGIGCSLGTIFASRLGMRGKKHNIILGEAVREADYVEDMVAEENEIAITRDMYNYLITLEKGKYKLVMEKIFIKRNEYYITTKGLNDWRNEIMYIKERTNSSLAKSDNSYKPWKLNE